VNINDLTLGQAKELSAIFQSNPNTPFISNMEGKKTIVRTYSAGVWFGELKEKSGNEVVLVKARRLWYWKAASGISLSSVAIHGIDQNSSKIVEAVNSVWLESIEIIPCTQAAIESIEGAPNVEAQ
jgi:hypothetical protein